MTDGALSQVLQRLRSLVGSGPGARESDADLLRRFANRSDQAAFTELVQRHSQLVLNVCHRVLRDWQAAEDAFQATFMVLARKANSNGWQPSIGNWLYTTALCIAHNARKATANRLAKEREARPASPDQPVTEIEWTELKIVLDEELGRLPNRCRSAMVLSYLEGKTNEQVASELGWPVGTVWSELSRGRKLLRDRLLRRGLAVLACTLDALIVSNAQAASESAVLVQAAVQAALQIAAGKTVVRTIPTSAIALAEGAMNAMFMTKLKMTAAVLLTVFGLLYVGLGLSSLLSHTQAASNSETVDPTIVDAAQPPGAPVQADVVPLRMKLIAKKNTYVLDRGGKTAEEYRKQLEAETNYPTIPIPQVDLTLEFKNTGTEKLFVGVGEVDSDMPFHMALDGTGAFNRKFTRKQGVPRQGPPPIELAPGGTYAVPVTRLASIGRNRQCSVSYWTQPGEYTLIATCETGISTKPFDGSTPYTTIKSAPLKLKVVEAGR